MASDYDAFISYSHSADSQLAARLEVGLQRFAKPWYKLRELRIFRDGTNLNLSSHLWESIRSSLERSAYLVYLASPAAAQSPWVGREIAYWLAHRQREKLIIVITDGDIAWDEAARDFDWSRTNCLPRALASAFEGEPFFLDMRWARAPDADLTLKTGRFTGDVALLSATLHGKAVEDMMGEELAQHRRTTRWRNGAIGALGLLLAVALAAAWQARQQRLEAERQRLVADERRVEAERERAIAQVAQQRAEQKQREADEQRTLADQRRAEAERQRRIAEQERDRAEAGAILTRVNAELAAGSVAGAAALALRGATRLPAQDSIRAAVRAVGLHPSAQLMSLRSAARDIDAMDISEDGRRILVVGVSRGRVREARLFDAQGTTLGVFEGIERAQLLDGGRRVLLKRPGPPVLQSMPDGSECGSDDGLEQLVTIEPRTASASLQPAARVMNAGAADGFLHLGFQSISADARRTVSLCGNWLLVNDADGTRRAAAAEGAVAARLAPTGALVAVQRPDGVRLLVPTSLAPAATGALEPKAQPPGVDLVGTAPVFAPDGRRVATVFGAESILWDVRGRELARRPGTDPRLGPGELWLTRSGDESLLWRGNATEPVRLTGVDARVSADGRWLTTTTADGGVHVWTDTGAPVTRLSGRIGLLSPLGPSVVTADAAGAVSIWDLRRVGLRSRQAASALWAESSADAEALSLTMLAATRPASPRPRASSTSAPVDPCGEPVATCSSDRALRVLTMVSAVGGRQQFKIQLRLEQLRQGGSGVWQTQRMSTPEPLQCEGPGTPVMFSPRSDGPIAIGCNDGQMLVFDRTGRIRVRARLPAPVSTLAWSADGDALAVGRSDGVVELRDAVGGEARYLLTDHESPPVAVQLGPYPGRAVTLTRHGVVRVWSFGLTGPSLLESTQSEADRFVATRLSADGRWLLAASESGALYRRAVADPAQLAQLYPWLAAPPRH